MSKTKPRAATPREIRRAFGSQALEAFNSHADAIAHLHTQVEQQASELSNLTQRVQFLEHASYAHEQRQATDRTERRAFVGRRFADRWAWLFTGQ